MKPPVVFVHSVAPLPASWRAEFNHLQRVKGEESVPGRVDEGQEFRASAEQGGQDGTRFRPDR